MSQYEIASLILSLVATLVFTHHAIYAARLYRRFHDERAARNLLIAVVLLVVSIGTLLSAFGLLSEETTLRLTGISIVRGSLLVGALVLLLMDRDGKEI